VTIPQGQPGPDQPSWGQQPQPGQPYPPGPHPPQPGTPGQQWAPPPPSKKKPNKVLIGCGGCAGVVALFVVIAAVAASGSKGGGKSGTSGTPHSVSSSSSSSKASGGGALTSSGNMSHPPQDDVKITSCSVDSTLNFPSAKLTITNHSSQPSSYMIQIEFVNSSGARVSDGYAAENTVRPGQTVYATAQGTDQVQGQVVCKAVSVDRIASAG
jgi:hypothetical protein